MRYDDEHNDDTNDEDIARVVDRQVKFLSGIITDAMMDNLDYEEEYPTFEPIRRRH